MPLLTRTLPARSRIRLPVILAGALTALGLSLAAVPTPAGALVQEVAGAKSGVQPREVSRFWDGGSKSKGLGEEDGEANLLVKSFNNPSGHAVMHSADVYAIYWDPQADYHGDWQGLIDGFLANFGASGGQLGNVMAADTQYRDTEGAATSRSSFRGAYTDTNPYPGAGCADPQPLEFGGPLICLTDAQVRAQLETFIAQHGLQRGMGTIFYMLTPPGVTVCLDGGGVAGHCSDFQGELAKIEKETKEKETKEEKKESFTESESYITYIHSFCSYHRAIGTGDGSTILYAMVPWTAGGAGDFRLAPRNPGYDCQDGGFRPAAKPRLVEEKEHPNDRTPKEQEEFEKLPPEQQTETETLENPHGEEPHQLGDARGPDGFWDEGLADLIINQIAVEQQNTVTDPLLNAWQDEAGHEATDECRNFFAPSSGSAVPNLFTDAGSVSNQSLAGESYYLNDAFNLAAETLRGQGVGCVTGVNLVPRFTAPNPVGVGEIVGLDGMESQVELDTALTFPKSGPPTPTYATFTWNFGDGTPVVSGFAPGAAPCVEPWLAPCAGSVFHSYQYGGTYNVTLTITDVGGNIASVTNRVTVVGPAAPSEAQGQGQGQGQSAPSAPSAQGAQGAAASASGGTTPTTTTKAGSKPVASASIVSRSLRRVLRNGLVIRYSVNEQVAGRFEVLLATSIAHRIGLHGPPATGLAKGTLPQTIIGKAILVTTKGGRSTIRIQFGKTTASRLRRLGKVSLTLRLVVRNASSGTTTVLSPITLSG